MKIRTALLLAAAVATLGACASKPKPVIQTPATTPPPAVESPPPAASEPVTQATLSAQEDLAAKAGDRVFFALDSHDLDGEAQAVLSRQADWLSSRSSVRVRIEGNADERGTREYNLALGARRAASVRQFLISRGVAATRLETVSYGKERPLDLGTGEDAWSRNRNAHTAIIGQ